MEEFYSTVSLDDPKLADKLEEWQFHYNWHRPHGKSPIDVVCELKD